ncbi:MAG: EpsI family protein [Verrucomicrobium sp.]|nr:EpsI family protein [Verrucomicrobium sp.]
MNQEPIPLWRIAAAALLGAAALALCLLAPASHGQTVAGVVLDLPYRVGSWLGLDQAISPSELSILPADTGFARKEYLSGAGDSIVCSIVLAGAEKRSIHRPEICLPGQGWTVRASQVVPVPLRSGRTLRVMCLTMTHPAALSDGRKIEIPAYYLYWFVGDGVTTPSHWRRIWLTSWDRILHHVNHRWAYVSVYSTIRPGGKDAVQTLEMLRQFIAAAAPGFQKSERQ